MKQTLIFTKSYNNRAAKFLKKNPQLTETYRKTLTLLPLNPKHSSLRLHPLQGKLKGLYSVSINRQYRITLELIIQDKQILLVSIGDHAAVY